MKVMKKRSANRSLDGSDEEESESSDSDYDSVIERDIAKKYGKGMTSKLKSSRKKRDDDDSDEDDYSKDNKKRGRGRNKRGRGRRRRRSHQMRIENVDLKGGRMVPEEEDRVEKFIGGLPDNIQGNVIAAEPTRLQDAVCIANNLMDQKLKG
ncbi:hypothetical protein Tco_0685691 [Tanacetum coccineum]